MKIIADVFKLPSGSIIPRLYCQDENGEVIRGITDTLLDLISESGLDALDKLEELLLAANEGAYKRGPIRLPDWSVNDKGIWVGGPETEHGYALVSNENIPEYSTEYGNPQQFSIGQMRAAMEHWRRFHEMIDIKGMEALLDVRFEGVI
jgi:hypothetical protein